MLNRSFAGALRVLTYNIHHCEGTDGRVDLERIAKAIRAQEPHLVAIQEVDRGTLRAGGIDQAAELSRLTLMPIYFGSNIRYQGGEYGNAVLASIPVTRARNHLLPNLDGREQRGALVVEARIPPAGGGEHLEILFIATHLDYKPGDGERIACADALEAILAGLPPRPAILAGDLNARPGSPPMEALGRRWKPVAPGGLASYPAEDPRESIDHI